MRALFSKQTTPNTRQTPGTPTSCQPHTPNPGNVKNNTKYTSNTLDTKEFSRPCAYTSNTLDTLEFSRPCAYTSNTLDTMEFARPCAANENTHQTPWTPWSLPGLARPTKIHVKHLGHHDVFQALRSQRKYTSNTLDTKEFSRPCAANKNTRQTPWTPRSFPARRNKNTASTLGISSDCAETSFFVRGGGYSQDALRQPWPSVSRCVWNSPILPETK